MNAMQTAAPRITLRSLECFRAIIEDGSATAAAHRLGLTQPAVSRVLGLLEQQIGFALFHRDRGRLVPTKEALAWYQEVTIALQSVKRVNQMADSLRGDNFGELTIVSPPTLAETILPELISTFIEELPNVRISLDSRNMETAREMVALRAVDCGFVKLPVDHPGLECLRLSRTGSACALAPTHRLASRRRIDIRDLQGESLVLLGKGQLSRAQLENAFRDAGVAMRVRVEAHTVGAACALARRGTGIAIVNEMLGLPYTGDGLVLRPFSPNILHEYAFMTSTGVPMTRVTRRFRERCLGYFSNLGKKAGHAGTRNQTKSS